MEKSKRLRNVGFIAFFLSGLCAMSSSIVVSILQEKYGFSYGMTGTLLSAMSIGSMVAGFASGILPRWIGNRWTVMILCSGYFLGYLTSSFVGLAGVLIAAFLAIGLAKGCAGINCTVLIGNNCEDRTKGMNLMHACYATGALLCPFLIALLQKKNRELPILFIALMGLVFWASFLWGRLTGKETHAPGKSGTRDRSYLRDKKFWLLMLLLFCQNAAESSVTGWVVTYYKDQGILSGSLSNYTVTILWGATLIGRLLIAFVIPIKNVFKAMSLMGAACMAIYGVMIFVEAPVGAIALLFAFAFAMAGINPMATASAGENMSVESMGLMLPVAGIGAVVMPWVIGVLADRIGLQAGMLSNLIPCIGILVLCVLLTREKLEAKEPEKVTEIDP